MRGAVAAGHPLTARAGADVLREGGNAVDAAVAAVLMSFVAESPLTGPGAGGFMLVHTDEGTHLLDFFVAAPGLGLDGDVPEELVPIDIRFSEDAVQRFNVGPSSCGAYGTTLGLAEALERFGSARLGDLTGAPARAAREGVEVVPMQAFLFEVLEPISAPDGLGVVGEYRYARTRARRPLKVTIPGPYTLSGRLRTGPGAVYPTRDAAAEAFVPILRAELEALVAEGASHIQIDDPSPAIHPDAPSDFAALFNAAVEPIVGRVRLGAHLCFGN